MNTSTETEITQGPIPLCDSRGFLNRDAIGWSRHPVHRCNVNGRWGRKKKWNYWCVTSPTHLFSVTLSTVDYAGLAFVYALDFKTRQFHEQTVLVPLSRGFSMPEQVDASLAFHHPKLSIHFEREDRNVILKAQSPDFGGSPLEACLNVRYPAVHETLSVVVPWNDRHFQYTSKHNTLPASGTVSMFGSDIVFNDADSFACLDFGRGVWPYSSFWNWAAASGRTGEHTIGLNFGAGWTDRTGSTENGICIDGRLTKISEDMEFAYAPSDFMKPWTLRTPGSNQVDLTFTPFFERVARSNVLLIRSEVHQCIGHFSGHVITDSGERIPVQDVLGWAEEHHARW